MSLLRQRLKPWMLPIAMLAGIVFHDFMGKIEFIAPYLIFIMLFITFCRVRPSEFRVTALSWGLLSVQVIGAVALYFSLLPFSTDLAQGTFICVFCPTATAAPVITGMLGGSVHAWPHSPSSPTSPSPFLPRYSSPSWALKPKSHSWKHLPPSPPR